MAHRVCVNRETSTFNVEAYQLTGGVRSGHALVAGLSAVHLREPR